METEPLRRILLVEDEPADAAFIRRSVALVSRDTVSVDIAPTLHAAHEALRRRLPDCALLDLELPDTQGPLDSLESVRMLFPDLPLIVVSGRDDPDLEVLAIAAGAQDYLVKGTVDGHTLLRSIRRSVERKRLELTVAETRADFAALAGHELRTPLTSISGYVELLRDGELGELRSEQEHALEVVARAAQRVEHLVGDLMVLADGDAGRLQIHRDPVNLAALVREAADRAARTARDVNVDLDGDIPSVLTVDADAAQVRHFVDSLLGGVVAVSPIGGRVVVGVEGRGESAVITVSGLGMGLPADKASELLDRCRRSPGPAALPALGLALGVAINIGEAHGGSVELHPDPGGGSVISVALPSTVDAADSGQSQRVPSLAAG